jgi:hypothetical protein
MMRGAAVTLAAIALTAGCGSTKTVIVSGGQTATATPSAPAVAQLPPCSVGHGKDGSTSTLSIRQHGNSFKGVYLNTPPGMASDTAVRFDVVGLAKDSRLTSTWTFGSVTLKVTGRYTAQKIVLDNPGGSFSTTVFRASSGCPPV